MRECAWIGHNPSIHDIISTVYDFNDDKYWWPNQQLGMCVNVCEAECDLPPAFQG